jgi:hypothetical protein
MAVNQTVPMPWHAQQALRVKLAGRVIFLNNRHGVLYNQQGGAQVWRAGQRAATRFAQIAPNGRRTPVSQFDR